MSSDLDFGYRFEPPAAPDHPGHRALTVVLRPSPTERHYDPERADFPTVSAFGDLERLIIFHPWPASSQQHASPGRVILADRKGKRIEAFTFGGTLSIDAGEARVVARLESPAPILPLLPPHDVAENLADEVEILLARRRAYWDELGRRFTFDERLAAVEPLALFRSCLLAIDGLFASTPAIFHDHERRLAHYLRQEIAAQAQAVHWPAHVPALDQIL